VTALYALQLSPEARSSDRIATVSLRWTDPDRNRPDETSRSIVVGDLAGSFRATDPHFRLDAIVAATAEALHGGTASDVDVRDVADVARDEAEDLPPTGQVHDFLDLLDQLDRRS
jgi:hypothetical protein